MSVDDYEMEQGPDLDLGFGDHGAGENDRAPEDFSIQFKLGSKGEGENVSPKRRGRPRREHDAYPTVDDLAKAIVERVATYCPMPERVVEPTAGEGAFVKALRARYLAETKIIAIDLVESYREACLAAGAAKFVASDFIAVPDEALASVDLIIGNPPFNAAAEIVAKCVRASRNAVIAFLLPVSFWGATKTDTKGARRDAAFWKANRVRYFAPLHPRPSFTGDGRTDRMEYGLFGFGGGWDGCEVNLDEPIVWK